MIIKESDPLITAYGFAVDDLDSDGLTDIVVARSDAANMIYFTGSE